MISPTRMSDMHRNVSPQNTDAITSDWRKCQTHDYLSYTHRSLSPLTDVLTDFALLFNDMTCIYCPKSINHDLTDMNAIYSLKCIATKYRCDHRLADLVRYHRHGLRLSLNRDFADRNVINMYPRLQM